MPDITFVKFNQNHYVELCSSWGPVLLVASKIVLDSLLLVNHPVYLFQNMYKKSVRDHTS
jgi:hypothetical protein